MRAMKKKLQERRVQRNETKESLRKTSEKKARLLNESTRRCKKMLRKN